MNREICSMIFLSVSLNLLGGCVDVEQPDPTQETMNPSSEPDVTENGGSVERRAENGGSVEIPFSDFNTQTVVNVGGGTWNYGRTSTQCWSHYVHPTLYHSATAIQGPINNKQYAIAGTWANADIFNGSGTCYAYWNTY